MSSSLLSLTRTTEDSPRAPGELAALRVLVDELTRERDQLLTVVDLQQELATSLQVADILQRITRRLGDLFGLDRSSIYLAGEGSDEVRLVATLENPELRNLLVDITRYPELAHAFSSGQTVFIPDAMTDPRLADVRSQHDLTGVQSIVVAPIRWRATVIGAIFLRTERGGAPFAERDIRFCEVIASLTAKALRNAHRFEQVERNHDEQTARLRRVELERIAFVAFLRRLLSRYASSDDQLWSETLLPRESDDELERLVSVAMQVIGEEAKG
ncbi:MAG: GAF domain-containing protein [Gemmatimonadaceae bacterium]|nr:GAF domain-containing protein [Gemmatimonadaceae bacterium]